MRTSVKVATALMFVVLAAYAPAGAPTSVAAAGAQLQSIGPLGFGPNGVMYAADSVAGKIYALDLGAQANGGAPGTANVDNFNQKIAAMLGTDAAQIAITDLAVDARTRNSFVSVMRGQGPAAKPALLRVDGAGAIVAVKLETLPVHERRAAEPSGAERHRPQSALPGDHAGEVRQRPRVGERIVERGVRVEDVVDRVSVHQG